MAFDARRIGRSNRAVRALATLILTAAFLPAIAASGDETATPAVAPGEERQGNAAGGLSEASIVEVPIEIGPAEDKPVSETLYRGRVLGDAWDSYVGGLPANEAPYRPIPYGFYCENKPRYFDRSINYRSNLVLTGDPPMLAIISHIGPARGESSAGTLALCYPSLGKLRLGVSVGSRAKWLDEFDAIQTRFLPGMTKWSCTDDEVPVKISVTATALTDLNGAAVQVAIEKPAGANARVFWAFGDMSSTAEVQRGYDGEHGWVHAVPREYAVSDDEAAWMGALSRHTSPSVPDAISHAGCDWEGQKREIPAGAEWSGVILLAWGIKEIPEAIVSKALDLIKNSHEDSKPYSQRLADEWYDSFVGRSLNTEDRVRTLLGAAGETYERSAQFWRRRAQRFEIDTPDDTLDCLTNWAVACGEYYYIPPGLTMGHSVYTYWPHISHGFAAYEATGEHRATADHELLRFALAKEREKNGRKGHDIIGYWGMDLAWGYTWEETTQFLVEQSWAHYLWTGDAEFIRQIYPTVKKIVDTKCLFFDPDGDGLFSDEYPYQLYDGHDDHAYSVTNAASCSAMLDAAAGMAEVAGDGPYAKKWRLYANKVRDAFQDTLWFPEGGIPTALSAGRVRYKHPESAEIYMPVTRGLLSPLQAYQSVRFAREHLLQRGDGDVTIFYSNDWYPLLLCSQWIGAPETTETLCSAFMAGDADNWYPALSSYINSCYRMAIPGLSYVTRRNGNGGGLPDYVENFNSYLKLIMWGIFGVAANVPEGTMTLNPSFPSSWDHASIRTPDFEYSRKRQDGKESFEFATRIPQVTRVVWNFKVTTPVVKVLADGEAAAFTVHPEVGRCRVEVPVSVEHEKPVRVELHADVEKRGRVSYQRNVRLNENAPVRITGFDKVELVDPQRAFESSANALEFRPVKPGMRTAFLKVATGNISYYWPLDFEVAAEPMTILDSRLNIAEETLWLGLRNNTTHTLKGNLKVRLEIVDLAETKDWAIAAGSEKEQTIPVPKEALESLLPGKSRLSVTLGDSESAGYLVSWETADRTVVRETLLDRSTLLDLSSACNTGLHELRGWQNKWSNVLLQYEPLPRIFVIPYGVPFACGGGEGEKQLVQLPADREKGRYGWDQLAAKVKGKFSRVYLLMAGLHRNDESYTAMGEVQLRYKDGAVGRTELVPGINFDWIYSEYAPEAGAVDYGKVENAGSHHIEGFRPHFNVLDVLADPSRELEEIRIVKYPVDAKIGIISLTMVE